MGRQIEEREKERLLGDECRMCRWEDGMDRLITRGKKLEVRRMMYVNSEGEWMDGKCGGGGGGGEGAGEKMHDDGWMSGGVER